MVEPRRKKVLLSVCLFGALLAMTIGIAGIAQQSAKEAPAGFNTPSFNSAQSISNGIAEPPGDTFAHDQNVYEENEAVKDGLGPVYNATSCVTCHQNPNSGAASQITELRVGHNDENGNFVNPTIVINDKKTRLPAGLSSMIAPSVRKPRSTYLRRKISAHCALPSTHLGMDLWKPLTTALLLRLQKGNRR